MEAGRKDCEEETLQTAFKKLRVDAESLSGTVNVSESLAPRAISRTCPEASGTKPKLNCPKDNWHGSMRKTSRGTSRSQRRRRSKSPILHPPKFTYCSSTATSSLSPSSGCLKHQCLAVPESVEPCHAADRRAPATLAVSAQKELSSLGASSHIPPPVFGAGAVVAPSLSQEMPSTTIVTSRQNCGSAGTARAIKGSGQEKDACNGEGLGAAGPRGSKPGEASDFQALSKLHGGSTTVGSCALCSCSQREKPNREENREKDGQGAGSTCQCQSKCLPVQPDWQGIEVYSFTGLRNVISESEWSQPGLDDAGHVSHPQNDSRTHRSSSNTTTTATSPSSLSPSPLSSGSPRSCSEQARAYVDDITIEDLSGYMEYYLYIPKKMSHMAEMMYT
ncbi:oxidative stress-responsive serine-rich protein 1 [Lampris incognitus]|uniref:oxidative stress-responsive serine-rich protein 1 n=1 Tax=Lampris incognitus TaxID=2546036 RepID=UPI0024B5919B|nr:oxidative stress-responsive serine-rich protein 1 [Lampris incognitus]